MAHPRSFDSDAVLAVLMEQFWEHGFQGASTRDLVDATRVRKASLYAAFGDKQAMYRTALVHYIDEEVGAADAMLMTAGGQSAIAALFDGVIEEVADGADVVAVSFAMSSSIRRRSTLRQPRSGRRPIAALRPGASGLLLVSRAMRANTRHGPNPPAACWRFTSACACWPAAAPVQRIWPPLPGVLQATRPDLIAPDAGQPGSKH